MDTATLEADQEQSVTPTLQEANSQLTQRQQAFVSYYIQYKNGARAAREAGYAANSAKVTAAKLLTNANVKKAVEEGLLREEWAKEDFIAKGKECFENSKDATKARFLEIVGKAYGYLQPDTQVNVNVATQVIGDIRASKRIQTGPPPVLTKQHNLIDNTQKNDSIERGGEGTPALSLFKFNSPPQSSQISDPPSKKAAESQGSGGDKAACACAHCGCAKTEAKSS